MASRIEQFLLSNDGTYAVVEIRQAEKRLTLSIAPWQNLESVVTADFAEAAVTSIDIHPAAPDELNVPWDIIGFDSYPLSENRWRFVLCCAGVEYAFESIW